LIFDLGLAVDLRWLRQQLAAQFPEAKREGMFVSRAPGRVNLIGEHTDYNDGFVCPMALDRVTAILAAPRADAVVRLHSLGMRETVEFRIDREIPHEGPAWALYPKGAAEAMRRRVALTRGFDAVVDSNVPLGGGLSSSASFELAMSLAVLAANGQKLPLEEVALACQWAEHHYPKMPCGIMDQFISALGQKGHALLLDCRDHSTRQVPLDDTDLRVVISNSNVKHALVGGEYAARRRQCEAAVAAVRKRKPAVKALRDVPLDILEDSRQGMEEVTFRRARHVITEIQRTAEFAELLGKRDYRKCGELMYASHASLRDDYEVSCAELDALVEIARGVAGVHGARMTGGGFGGCIVALCRAAAVEPLTAAIATDYPAKANGKQAATFATVASAGASVEPL
jgi:galactokinase